MERIYEMLLRGVAVHHGGLLPLLKECVELLFSKSIVKVSGDGFNILYYIQYSIIILHF